MMSIEEVDKLLYTLTQRESSNLTYFLLGYAKSNKRFRKEFVKAIDARFEK